MKYDIDSIKNRKNIEKTVKRVIGIFLIIIIYNVILVAISNINGSGNFNLFGYKAYTITSNSMSPSINIGNVVIVKTCKKEELKKEDIITFNKNGEKITHRIINIDENNKYVTKGDNNNTEDVEKVDFENVEGKVVLTIPYFGYIIKILDNKIIFLIIILIILIICYYKIEKQEKKENRREKKKIEETKKSI